MPASQRTIPRERVIPGARDDDFHVGDLYHSDHRVKRRSVTLTRAQVQALNGTPVVILPAVTGRRYLVLGAHMSKGAAAYVDGADVTLNYINDDNNLAATFDDGHFTGAAVANAWAALPARTGTVAAQTFPAGGIDANVGTAFTGNGADVTITVLYVERDDDHDLEDENEPLLKAVTLNAAAVQGLDTTPVEVVPAEAGYRFLVLGLHIQKAVAAYAAGDAVLLRYTGAGTPTAVTIPASHFTGGAANAWIAPEEYSGAPAALKDPDGGLELSTGTGFTGAGANVTINVRYVKVPVVG